MFEVRIQHQGLKAFRLIKGHTRADVELKARLQRAIWEEKWTRLQKSDELRRQKKQKLSSQAQSRSLAASLSGEAAHRISEIETLLSSGLAPRTLFSWDMVKDRTPFPVVPGPPAKLTTLPAEPARELYRPSYTLWARFSVNSKRAKEAETEAEYEAARSQWELECRLISCRNSELTAAAAFRQQDWLSQKQFYEQTQKKQHEEIDAMALAFKNGDPDSVSYFFSEVLLRSPYPDGFPEECTTQYDSTSKMLVIDYELPPTTAFPLCKEIRYNVSKHALQEIPLGAGWLRKTYDKSLYQIALRSLHEVFAHDSFALLNAVCFNGWVRSVDKSTGTEAHACILSLQVSREEFTQLNLGQVDAKACFHKLKGVASSELVSLSPVRPIIAVKNEDPRFVDSYAVLSGVDERTNLAAMGWQDFENLIREVFEKEFSKNGGEVRITQASRDGGVDAIAFDPDPIRGGKVVIQAKRYTNVVGVAAVRDLFGTVHNEGATKGILVTTSTYGPDAYKFAKGKPLTLLNGSELLGLLEKYGHKTKIDLVQARALQREGPGSASQRKSVGIFALPE